jgi:hypothetical protein
MKTNLLILLAVLSLTGLSSCLWEDANPNALPEINPNGPNFMACYINGKKWVSEGCQGNFMAGSRPLHIYYSYYPDRDSVIKFVEIYAYNCKDQSLFFRIRANIDIDTISPEPITPRNTFDPVFYSQYNNGRSPGPRYLPVNNSTGKFTFLFFNRYGTTNNCAGTFNMRLVNTIAPYDTINVTEGRFYYDIDKL